MKQIGILFQGDMALATYEGRKTLTSRLRGLEKLNERPDGWRYDGLNIHGDHLFFDVAGAISGHDPQECVQIVRCPYGQPGGVLIGRETFKLWNYSLTQVCVEYRAGGEDFIYEFPLGKDKPKDLHRKRTDGHKPWRPSMLMPWWASRLHLEVVRVWPSRLRDMTEEMAVQEGVDAPRCPRCGYTRLDCQFHGDHRLCPHETPPSAIPVYAALWDRINGKNHPWRSNPWVWRIQFKRL